MKLLPGVVQKLTTREKGMFLASNACNCVAHYSSLYRTILKEMRKNSSSSFASSTALDEVATASSSTAQPENPDYMRTLRQYGRYFSTRLVQVVVQSRTNEKFDLECTLPSSTPDWFNLRIDELGEVSAQVKRSISSFPPVAKSIAIDFMLYTCDGEVLPMETWTFSVDEEDQQLTYYVKKQSCDTFVILYKLGEGSSELDLGSEAKRIDLGRFPTPVGAFKLEVAYRTQMAKERALSPREGHESPNQMSIIMATPSDAGTAIGSPAPSSYCELMSEFSTSPASLPATSPPDTTHPNLKTTTRSRSKSLACEPETTSSSPKTKPVIAVAKNMPFANLLTVSYTGVLFPLPEEVLGRKKCHSESAILEGNGNEPAPSRCDSFSRLLCAGDPGTAKVEPAGESKETSESKNEQNVQVEAIVTKGMEEMKVDDVERPAVKVNFDLECSERTLVDPDSDSQTEGSRKGDMEVEEQDESVATLKRSEVDPDETIITSDDDSFVKIPLFGRVSCGEAAQEGELDTHLTEFVTSCKAPPPLVAVPQEWDTLSDIQSLLEGFSQKQGLFDKFVAEAAVYQLRSEQICQLFVILHNSSHGHMRLPLLLTSLRRSSQFAGVRDRAKYIPRRSLLYVPASNQKMLDKVPNIKADCVVLELEDGVALTSKAIARTQATKSLDKLAGEKLSCFELGLRVNSVASGLLEDDVKKLSLSTCVDNFTSATRTPESTEVLYARQRFVACCKAFQLQAIDSVYIDIKNLDGLRKQCEEGTQLRKVPVVQEAFMPPAEKVEWATELVHAFSQHQAEGKGAFQFRGQMIDRPLLLQALNIIQLVESVGGISTGK
ncbi:hypothetical protein ANCCEY_13709 [Ancylostoma ceylanicum]|uniref:HpcH/HpaI aldolase/citrate lyase domain-containing protein n=1 Tax=Ancylostoma ceylanicum TaxID=53326 RepID=A0A0D6L858_9BILA|nr:hypothetical protein ANCCEY_13709 [Ancylostoma ceylanicum]